MISLDLMQVLNNLSIGMVLYKLLGGGLMHAIFEREVMKNNKKSAFFVLLLSCILVTVGDLRNIVSPSGYWVLWGVVFFIGLFSGNSKLKLTHEVIAISAGFFLMIMAFFLAGLANSDLYTLYQAVKYFAIYLIFIVIYNCSSLLGVNDFYRLTVISILVSLLVFLSSKYIFTDFYISSGDGRQGSVLAYPGVLWKVSAFFSPFVIAAMFSGRIVKLAFGLTIFFISVYILLADSSRTGFIWFSFIIFSFYCMFFWLFPLKMFIASTVALLLGLLVFFLMVGHMVLIDYSSLLVLNRLFDGDPVRAAMIVDGVSNAEKCIPFGCGFGSSLSLVAGEPMVVHNVYLSILGDAGIIGEISLLVLIFLPVSLFVIPDVLLVRRVSNVNFKLAAVLGVSCYCFLMALHPLSSEMSEWGYWIIMISWLSCIYRKTNAEKHI